MAGYIGSKAAVVSSGYPTGAERKNTFTITGTTTVLAGLSYTPNFTHVYHSGVRLVAGTDYTATDGTTITLTVAAENGDEIVVISYATFQVADAYTKAEADAEFVSDPNGAVTVDGSGNVGIGTASTIASADFTVNSATNTRMNLASDGVERFGVFADNGIAALYAGGTSVMTLSTNATERMRIDASGNVLVGKNTTVYTTDGAIVNPLGILAASRTNGAAAELNRNGTDGFLLDFFKAGVRVGYINVTGSATSYVTSSDYRLKENITAIQGAGDIVKMMRPCTYTFKSDGSWHDGFLAHELQELHPRAVTGSKDAMQDEEYEVTPAVLDEDGVVVSEAVMGTRSVPDYQGVDYSKLTPILTAALKEALTKIEVLEAQNAIFETRLTALEAT